MRPNAQDITDFKAKLRGTLIQPGEVDYDAVRVVWNGMIDRRPSLIARCHGVADVIASVDFARSHGLRVAVRGGGHNVAGYAVCDGGLMIDLSPHARRPRRSAGAPGLGPGRRHLGRRGPRDNRSRPRNAGWRRVDDRGRWPHLVRRDRLVAPDPRPLRRQRCLGGHRDRRRPALACRRRRAIPTCSGPCAAAAGISASLRHSSSDCIRSRRS